MADLRRQQHGADGDQQYYSAAGDQQGRYPSSDIDKSTSMFPQQQQQQGQGPSASQIIAVVTLVPLGGTLLLLAGLTLAATFVGVAVSTPVFVIFSPVLVPAIITVALAVAGILTSGAFGITGLSSFSWLANYLRRAHLPQQTIRGVHDTTDQWMQKAKDLGQTVSSDKAHETGDAVSDKAQEAGQNVQTKAHEAGQKAHDTGRTREGGKTREVRVA